jgi:hypothetical protein
VSTSLAGSCFSSESAPKAVPSWVHKWKKLTQSPQSLQTTTQRTAHNLVNFNVDRQRVKDSPAYDASTTVDRAYETKPLRQRPVGRSAITG